MQPLIPLVLAISLASSTPLNLLPYAYLSSPIPVYQQFQNTRTGEHAFSYAGGPSAQEEVKGADGVLRGSYSYIDANGILQSAFYVADENGFRVAATNLPSDENVDAETAHIILARSTNPVENSRSTRRRRSILLEESNSNPAENQENQKQQEQQEILQKDGKQVTLKAVPSSLLLTSGIPLATSHQSQVQVHSNARLDVTEGEVEAKPVDLQPILPPILGGLQVLRAPTYHENRIELHKELGIEGPRPKDAVKIEPDPLTILQTPPAVLPVASTLIAEEPLSFVPVIANEPVPILPAARIGTSSVTTSISSHGLSQIHDPTITKTAIPAVVTKESIPLVPIAKEVPTATVTTSISSHGISQIHGNSKVNIEPLLVKTAHIAPLVDVPIYLH